MQINNPTSFVSYKIIILDFIKNDDSEDSGNQIATATGFIYKRNGMVYLITNWHVVNERDFWDKRRKHSERHPTHVLFTPSFSTSETNVVKDNRAILLELYDSVGNPKWLVHPKWKNDIDTIAIPIGPISNYADLYAINDAPQALHMNLSVTDELFVIGYPYGQGSDQKGTLPIWKKCTVASEPEMEFLSDKRPTFLIDGITNPSMSGSPVIRFIKGSINTPNGLIITQPGIELCGVYSGRIYANDDPVGEKNVLDFDKIKEELKENEDTDFKSWIYFILQKQQDIIAKFVNKTVHKEIENDTKIGLVWKANLIDEIIDANQKDQFIYDSDLEREQND